MKTYARAFPELAVRLETAANDRRAALRDKFAGQAMQAMLTGRAPTAETVVCRYEFADCAYIIADAMLAARATKELSDDNPKAAGPT